MFAHGHAKRFNKAFDKDKRGASAVIKFGIYLNVGEPIFRRCESGPFLNHGRLGLGHLGCFQNDEKDVVKFFEGISQGSLGIDEPSSVAIIHKAKSVLFYLRQGTLSPAKQLVERPDGILDDGFVHGCKQYR